ncbi:hypothetical protein [Streptomyces sp. NPDC051546]|uniref:hypothetical protein n=1 Tax=Streptomyces sp. NPDC051546 TaxID=3365655 RepID=UPI0037ACF3FF
MRQHAMSTYRRPLRLTEAGHKRLQRGVGAVRVHVLQGVVERCGVLPVQTA